MPEAPDRGIPVCPHVEGSVVAACENVRDERDLDEHPEGHDERDHVPDPHPSSPHSLEDSVNEGTRSVSDADRAGPETGPAGATGKLASAAAKPVKEFRQVAGWRCPPEHPRIVRSEGKAQRHLAANAGLPGHDSRGVREPSALSHISLSGSKLFRGDRRLLAFVLFDAPLSPSPLETSRCADG